MTTGAVILLVVAFCVYFLPTLIAGGRGKANGEGGVFLVNLLLGWTVLGWFVAFIWACSGETRRDVERREEQHNELIAALRANGQEKKQ